MRMKQMSKKLQRRLVLTFLFGMLVMIFLPLVILDDTDYLATPNTATITVAPQMINSTTYEETMTCADAYQQAKMICTSAYD